jgi:glutathione S-transferase
MSTPTKPFLLYTGATPNGFQVSILLEELKAINPSIDYEYALTFSPYFCI